MFKFDLCLPLIATHSAGELGNFLPDLQCKLVSRFLGQFRLNLLDREVMGLPSPEAALQDHYALLGWAALSVEVGDLVALVFPC